MGFVLQRLLLLFFSYHHVEECLQTARGISTRISTVQLCSLAHAQGSAGSTEKLGRKEEALELPSAEEAWRLRRDFEMANKEGKWTLLEALNGMHRALRYCCSWGQARTGQRVLQKP